MNRRKFLAGALVTAAGLILPYEPKRIYSFPSREYLTPELKLDRMHVWPREGFTVIQAEDVYRSGRVEQRVFIINGCDEHVTEQLGPDVYALVNASLKKQVDAILDMDIRDLVTV